MSSTIKHKPNLAAQMNEHEMPEYKGKWRVMRLWSNAPASYGNLFHNTQQLAKQSAVTWEVTMANKMQQSGTTRIKFSDGIVRDYKNHLMCIQIPVSA